VSVQAKARPVALLHHIRIPVSKMAANDGCLCCSSVADDDESTALQVGRPQSRFSLQQDNVQLNTESVQCISIAYSEVRITEISEQLTRVDQGD